MRRNESAERFVRMLVAGCVVAAICSSAGAQSPVLDEQVGFASVEICEVERIGIPLALRRAAGESDGGDLPIHSEADSIESEADGSIVLRGNARITRGGHGVYADQIVYRRDTRRARAEGGVVLYTAGGDEIRADVLQVDVDSFAGEGADIRIRMARRDGDGDDATYMRARATAQSAHFTGGDFQRFDQVALTTCAEGSRDVILHAKELELDHAAGFGSAKSMTVRFKGLPIFHFPTATFPIDDRRKTGFLFPAAGYDGESGLILETPYYINIAPQYDATLTPRLLSRRGAQIYGQFRYLGANGGGSVRGEFLPSDRAFDEEDRHAFGLDHRQKFGDRWRALVDWRTISDASYLRDFSDAVGSDAASSYVAQRAQLDYFGDDLRIRARVAAHDSANDAVARADLPYEVLPELKFDWKPQQFGLFTTAMTAQYTNFRHAHRDRIHGSRLRARPSVSMPLESSWGYVAPTASLQSIRYSLEDHAPRSDDSPSVEIPIFSIDGHLYFERDFDYGGTPYRHTLEPRLFYLTIPRKLAQREFPNFDTSDGSDSSFDHFFRENRFFGGDRVGDTEHIAVGVSNRIVDDHTGRQRLRLSLGQVFYLRDRKLGLSADSEPDTEDTSGLLAEVAAAISANWNLRAFARWGEGGGEIDSARLAADYRHGERRSAHAAYIFKDDDSEQVNVAFEAPAGPRWQLHGNGAYSLEEDETRSAGLGFSFDGCCWAARVVAQRYLDGTGDYNNRLTFTFELDDLGRLRSRL